MGAPGTCPVPHAPRGQALSLVRVRGVSPPQRQAARRRMDVPVPASPRIRGTLHQPPLLYPADRNLIRAGS